MKVKNEMAVSTYRDYLCTMKVYYRDYLKQPEIIQDYKFPSTPNRSRAAGHDVPLQRLTKIISYAHI